ncbi:MAG: beta-ketoacyl synthase N-terminal-like domain-containing protein [Candidatus Aadella gelida]|nr:beta-ketoacyl synthase N-terminal-like domain-containing protein [Candidatus Aadella gelida]
MYKKKRIVITGVGIVSPFGTGKRVFWSSIKNGRSGICKIKGFETRGFPCKMGGEVPETVLRRHIGKDVSKHVSRATKFGLIASKLALKDAGSIYPVSNKKRSLYGLSLGISIGNISGITALDKEILKKGPRFISPSAFPNVCPNASASHISMAANITGFSITLSAPSTSGLDAISSACRMIQKYGYSTILAGATEDLSWDSYETLSALKCMSKLIPGEGACLYVLESLASARRRKAKIYAEIKGYGTSFDPKEREGLSSNTESIYRAMKMAVEDSGHSPRKVNYVLGSSNSAKSCDQRETRAAKRLFGTHGGAIPVISIKSMTGETFSASGPFNIAAAIMAIRTNFIPGVSNYKARGKKINNVMINSTSGNGFNSSIIVGSVD